MIIARLPMTRPDYQAFAKWVIDTIDDPDVLDAALRFDVARECVGYDPGADAAIGHADEGDTWYEFVSEKDAGMTVKLLDACCETTQCNETDAGVYYANKSREAKFWAAARHALNGADPVLLKLIDARLESARYVGD